MSEYRKEAWTDGEAYIFGVLCEATGAVPSKTAFLGMLPPQTGSWALDIGGGVESSPFKDMPPGEIKFDGILQGHFAPTARDLAQRTALQWLSALPIRQQDGPVYVCRASAPPRVTWGYIPVMDDKGVEKYKVGCWQVTLELEAVLRIRY